MTAMILRSALAKTLLSYVRVVMDSLEMEPGAQVSLSLFATSPSSTARRSYVTGSIHGWSLSHLTYENGC